MNMRTRKKDQKNLVKAGIFLSALTAVAMVMIVSIGKENSIFEPKTQIRAHVTNVSNLKPGSYVELKGIRIGTISEVSILNDELVEIDMEVLEKDLKWIRRDSRVAISNAGLVGDKFVEIIGGSKDSQKFDPSQDVLLSEDAVSFTKLMSKGESIAAVSERILTKLDTILHNLKDGQPIVQAVESINRTAGHMERIARDLEKAHVGKVVSNLNQSMEKMNRSVSSLESILQRVEQGPGSAHSIIYDDDLHEDLRTLLGGAERNKVIKYFIRESIRSSEKKN